MQFRTGFTLFLRDWSMMMIRMTLIAVTLGVVTAGAISAQSVSPVVSNNSQQLKTYNWQLEAFLDGRVIASEAFTNNAESYEHAASFADNRLAVFGQQLTAKGFKYNRTRARLINSSN